MPGVLTYILVAIASFVVVYLFVLRWESGLTIFVGNFIHDILKFGVPTLRQRILAILSLEVMASSLRCGASHPLLRPGSYSAYLF